MMIGRRISMSWISGWRASRSVISNRLRRNRSNCTATVTRPKSDSGASVTSALEQHPQGLEERRVAEVVEAEGGGGLAHEGSVR